MKKLSLMLLLACMHTLLLAQVTSGIHLSPVLQSKMVIQQNKPFKVWGQTPSGTELTITADWLHTPVKVEADSNDQFMAILNVPAISVGDFSSHQLKISSGMQEIVLDSLLIGDLWFCSGQSNMQFSMKEEKHAATAIPKADEPHLRLFNTALNFSDKPIDSVKGNWQTCTPQTVKDFSAVAYYMGKTLLDSLNYPIGLVFTGIGASAAQAYVPKHILAADELLNARYLKPYLDSPKSKEKIDGGFSFEKVTRPYLLYNAMIYPFTRLSIKGFAWYQGEANHMERASYTHLTQTLIKAWRAAFAQGQLPFFYVQIAPFFHDKEDPTLAFDAYFREAQEKVLALNNTEMVVSMDVGEAKDLHPKNKKPLGERLAWTALNRTYGKLNVAYRGPQFQHVEFKSHTAFVHFDPKSVGKGLQTNDGQAPAHFYLAGKDQKFYQAKAEIVGNTIKLTATEVEHPVAVRYAFYNYPVTNLENKAGIPAVPFRTDSWPEQ